MADTPPPPSDHGQAFLLRQWQRRGWVPRLLWPVSAVLGGLVALRRGLYRRGWLRSERVPAVVLVVGNVVAGGAGKTPTVLAVVERLRQQGLAVGVVSRGHGRHTRDCREVQAHSLATEVGDEPLLIQRRTGAPVFVARRRAEAARALLAAYPATRVIVCDDGLQHLALQRDIELCVFDDRGVGNGWLQPAGPLREAWPRPVDLVLHTGEQPAFAGYRAQRRLAAQAVNRLGEQRPLASLRGHPLHALAGIAQPNRFFDMLRAAGLPLARCTALPDHHDFGQGLPPAGAPEELWLCTEKDAHKLWPHWPQAWAVPLVFEPEPAFWADLQPRLAAALSSLPPAPPSPSPTPHGQQTS
ncbi:tetraacyldisaccharide 4'-kinase [Curvibacter sp. HBC61]|uniref:Tetraacyldisaccharide 4'-kinase n=1 Tax=Curvibacter cyanobacteriorum TaxID=3026422 RepID=A0ABT5MTM3_9BURK|nr:tetraacyldisaccharide 4'-kinase [Curvibacter sp. HBC61]MDD0837178.1 tetraacyldisaccharide 4'-kinase [Curvibacter sp. HBC61]